MNKVIAYLQKAFEGRDLEQDAAALEMKVEELKALVEHGGMITAAFAKKLEAKIESVKAVELLDTQLEQAKDESRSVQPALTKASKKTEAPRAPRAPSQGSAQPFSLSSGSCRTAYKF